MTSEVDRAKAALHAMWTKDMVEKAWRDAVRVGLQADPRYRDRLQEQDAMIEALKPIAREKLKKNFPQFYAPPNETKDK